MKPIRHKKGQSIVEFTFILPVFLLLVLGIVQAGLIFINAMMIKYAVYMTARVAVVYDDDTRLKQAHKAEQMLKLGLNAQDKFGNITPDTFISAGTGVLSDYMSSLKKENKLKIESIKMNSSQGSYIKVVFTYDMPLTIPVANKVFGMFQKQPLDIMGNIEKQHISGLHAKGLGNREGRVRRLIKGKKGQVLVMSIAAILVIFILAIVVVEAGNLIYQKTHMQNIADSGAIEGGLWYARSLNVLSLSNKVLGLAAVAGVIGTFMGAPEVFKISEVIQKVQDVIAGTGAMEKIKPMPWLAELAVLRNGKENGVFSLALFNVADFQGGYCLPSFNVARRYLSDEIDADITYKKKQYSVKKNGRRVILSDKQAKRLEYEAKIKNRKEEWQKKMFKNDREFGTTFVKAEWVDAKVDLPLDIKETDGEDTEHTVLVFSFKKDVAQMLDNGFLKNKQGSPIKPAFLLSTAMVRISGGSLDIFDMAGANFSPRMEHVTLPDVSEPEKLKKTLSETGDLLSGTGLDPRGSVDGLFKNINSGIKKINDNILLH